MIVGTDGSKEIPQLDGFYKGYTNIYIYIYAFYWVLLEDCGLKRQHHSICFWLSYRSVNSHGGTDASQDLPAEFIFEIFSLVSVIHSILWEISST